MTVRGIGPLAVTGAPPRTLLGRCPRPRPLFEKSGAKTSLRSDAFRIRTLFLCKRLKKAKRSYEN